MNERNATLCSPRQSSKLDPSTPALAFSVKPTSCPTDHIVIKVDRFGFSANNITYQALGEHPHLRYFDFHSAPDSANDGVSSKTHGVIPVWGFGTVVQSAHTKVREGERLYGYFAPARYLLLPISSTDANKYAIYVPRPHLPADRRPYNQILRCSTDPQYSPSPVAEDMTMLYRPLFWTAYWCEDWLHTTGYRGGASSILVSSASSKTAFCFAYRARKRIRAGELGTDTKIIGLTSKRNTAFTQRLGLYDEVLDYDAFLSSPSFLKGAEKKWLYVDVAGNEDLNARIKAHFASPYTGKMAGIVSLGFTNLSPTSSDTVPDWSTHGTGVTSSSTTELVETSGLASQFWPRTENFFTPEWLDVRQHQIPLAEIFSRQNTAWKELMEDGKDWVQLERVYGAKKVQEAYVKLAKEGLGPDKGLIWSMWDEEPRAMLASRL
ncbi:hypothetical protein D9619_007951 [Psilocybe cf. subviscida]|uniref:DUF2855 family protein n=1 Tax=Psilocybe cf. subviscida TaxID=2480587 RepID=A0A8H5ATJ3_9AGAR|nr:hypothetical protein D9619_007951 [Psilocybe cf. subviscida]